MMTKTRTSDGMVLILDDDGRIAALDLAAEQARLLYTDPDEELLKAAEAEAAAAGRKKIVCDYLGSGSKLGAFLEGLGYQSSNTTGITAVKIGELLSSKAVKKSMAIEFPDAEWIPFRDLLLYQLEELSDECEKNSIPLKREDIARFDEDLSGIVYDGHGRIQSFVLVSEAGDDILIECLFGTNKNDPKFIMSALQGFAKEIIDCSLLDIYERIVVLEYNKTIRPLMKRLLDSVYELEDIGMITKACKELEGSYEDLIPEENKDSFFARKAQAVLGSRLEALLYQRNINWKSDWKIN